MFKSRLLPIATCCLGVALLISSSGWFGKSSDGDKAAEPESVAVDDARTEDASFFDDADPPPAVAPTAQQRLLVGDRFSYLKTVDQRITQRLPEQTATGGSRLTIGLSLEVEDVVDDDLSPAALPDRRPGDKRLKVHYHNVKFVQDIPGQEVNYDSDQPRGPVPPQAEAYRGLPGRGFSFWLDGRNQLQGLVGFQDFLDGCLQQAAPEQRTLVWKSLAGISEADNLANFVDEGIGLLPLDTVATGTTWRRQRTIQQPIPVTLQLQYTITDTTAAVVDVAVGGTVAPQAARDIGSAQLEILGGRISGRCSINRHTGLPENCRIDQTVEMAVHLASGESITQTKQTITQLSVAPDDSMRPAAIPYAGREKDSRLR